MVIDGALGSHYDKEAATNLKTQIIKEFQENQRLRKEIKQGQAGEPPETIVNETWDFFAHRIWEHTLAMEHTVQTRQQNMYWQTLSPQIKQLAEETSAAMLSLAGAVRSRQSPVQLIDLETTLNNVASQFNKFEQQINQVQKQDKSDSPIDELMRFFTFFYTMEEVGRKLLRMAKAL